MQVAKPSVVWQFIVALSALGLLGRPSSRNLPYTVHLDSWNKLQYRLTPKAHKSPEIFRL